jgi:hypothetical protein
MNPDPFNFWKLISGFFPVSGKNTAKLVYYIVLFAACMFVYNKWIAVKPYQNTISGGTVTINQTKPVVKIIQVWRIMIAWEK